MFSDFTKAFSREFFVGFFLPAILFMIAAILVYLLFQPTPPISFLTVTVDQIQGTLAVSGTVFASWLAGVLLLLANRPLIRLLEGYYIPNWTPLLGLQLSRYDKMQKKIAQTEAQYKREIEKDNLTPETQDKYMRLLVSRRIEFPPERIFVLATAFGNIIRAFETYPRAMYGIDAIPMWPRLIAVIPSDYRDTINGAKSGVDFAANMFYLSLTIMIEYGLLAFALNKTPAPWILLILAVVFWSSYRMALSSAAQWGNLVKGAFDLYRGELLNHFGIKQPQTWEEERRYWTEISQSLLYWYEINLPRVTTANNEQEAKSSKELKVRHS
jgi:hypothetical protein